jgi:single-strand DNA-binding protein
MANDINRVILIGRLTRDPELKSTNNGNYVCNFTLASNRSIYNRNTQESRDEVGFFDCVCWGKSGEAIQKYVQKGQRLLIDGNLRWESWEGKDGKKQSKVKINVESFQFIERRGDSGDSEDRGSLSGSAGSYDGGGAMSDDDIPF